MLRRLDGHPQEIAGGRNSVKQAALPPCALPEPSMPELISDDLKDRATGKPEECMDAGERRFRAEPR